ncbi:DNA-binding response regulator [Leminorella grimontii]|uniref:DNA-binding response regulator n=1 Tax=Leminorella grimontii TaxID=82981 RepID=A0AAV5N4F5_9GAMM|nr:response regulator [Leminorella grimontii]KFC94523.1 LuxR family DNA-binding response regulator [Leminorella grimontii ATCC 33999 = DSM 5078]GKX56619.1 DNA-binding response regulator [Leminorella grimontii]VFS61777.1 Transcriptional regulatory protein fixJ [Leminorella grimontii]
MLKAIYLVDDDPAIRDSLIWLLEAAGIRLISFSSADAFLQQVDVTLPGCVLLDICMPGMTGVELQEQLMRQDNVLSVIFLTGHADVPTASKIFKNGAFDLLEKPVDIDELLRVIRQALINSQRKFEWFEKHYQLRNAWEQLTEREKQILALVLEGLSNKVIADRLYLALRTVEIHRHNMMKKMGSDSPIQLAHALSKYMDVNSFTDRE